VDEGIYNNAKELTVIVVYSCDFLLDF